MKRVFVVPVLLLAGLSLVFVSCSSDDESGESDNTETAVTAGGGGTPVSVDVSDESGDDSPMTMTVSPESVAAGEVTFTLTNNGTVDHEMVVLKTDTAYDQLEVTNDKVSEADSVGEISEIAAGETGTVTLDLEAGEYVLVCNIAKHYAMGMRAPFTVT